MKQTGILALTAALAFACGGVASSPPSPPPETELWVTAQDQSQILIFKGQASLGSMETVALRPGTGPHIVTFSPDRKYAYAAGMGNGDLVVLRASDRSVQTTLNLGPAGTHQAKPSPDGSLLLVSQVATKSLLKVTVDAAGALQRAGTLQLAPSAPICTVFRDDGLRAYVSLLPEGLAVVDVPTLTLRATLHTAGFIACGMVKSNDGRSITLASAGGGGHLYRLSTETDTLTDLSAIGAPDWHSFTMTTDGTTGYGTSPASEEVMVIELAGGPARMTDSIRLDPTPGAGNDLPDRMAIRGNTLYVSLRGSGKLAIVDLPSHQTRYLDLAPPSAFAVHEVTFRN